MNNNWVLINTRYVRTSTISAVRYEELTKTLRVYETSGYTNVCVSSPQKRDKLMELLNIKTSLKLKLKINN